MSNYAEISVENPAASEFQSYDLICLSHLRWDFVYQRPQHLMSRFAKQRRVFFVEEPILIDGETKLSVDRREDNLYVVIPHFNRAEADNRKTADLTAESLAQLFRDQKVEDFVLWYYTPMAMNYTENLQPKAVVFDCMDELSMFKFAPPELLRNEAKLFAAADIVFTGGQSLYEAKRRQHPNVWAFPSSIDAAHFNKARTINESPADQKQIPTPRLGYVGVIDERINLGLIAEIAEKRPEWQIVMIGPVVKISEEDLPRRDNIHYLGMKNYDELPAYIAGWNVALMPFAINDSTKFISPTKTPEYLAAGKPVISTAIRDVVRPYGEQNLVAIADTGDDFVAAAEICLTEDRTAKLEMTDKFLRQTSWDKTFQRMSELIDEAITEKHDQRRQQSA